MTKRDKIIYWISTIWLSLGMVSTGFVQLSHGSEGPGAANSMVHLGYPVYFLNIIGVWKILGVIAVLLPGFALVKEWAYAGFFFAMTGALFSHIALVDPISEMLPSLLLLVLTVVSWYFRPADRKVISLKP